MERPNLKKTLMDLGNRLVLEHGFDPALGLVASHARSTEPIEMFTRWLNQTPEAVEVLRELGMEWPVIPRPR